MTSPCTRNHPPRPSRLHAVAAWFDRPRAMPEWDGFDMPFLFAIAGIIGTLWEEILVLVTSGVFENRSGSIITPVNWVYGLGAVAMFLALHAVKRPWQYAAWGALLGGGVEYLLSVLQEVLLGTRSWDYSGKFLNIGGRTTVPYMLVWGLLCMACMCWVFPPLLRLVHRMGGRTRRTVAVIVAVVMLVDLSLMLPAIVRYGQRAHGVYFDNPYCRWVDRVFDDGFMRSKYPNMEIS